MLGFSDQCVLVISPHQDDLEIGCGGIVQKFLAAGSDVHVVHGTLVDLAGTYRKYDKATDTYTTYTGAQRFEETRSALAVLGGASPDAWRGIVVHDPLFSSDKHHRIDTVPLSERIEVLESVISAVKPTVLLYAAESSNQDHEALARTVRSVMRPHFYSGMVIEYEIGDEVAFVPNLFVPMTDQELRRKLDAFEAYETQQSGDLHVVSECGIQYKAQYRGKQCYHPYAEAFRVLRMVAG